MDTLLDIIAFLLDFIANYWGGILVVLAVIFAVSKFAKVLFRELLEVFTAINVATQDGKLTGDEIRTIITEGMDAKGNIVKAFKQLKDDLRSKTIRSSQK